MSNYNEQTGGLWSVDIYLSSGVSGWSPVMNDDNSNLLVFPSVAATLQVEENGITIREINNTSTNGSLFNTGLIINTIGLDKGVQSVLDELNHKEVIIKTTDHEGIKKIYGTNLNPLTINVQTQLGQNKEQGQGATITCNGTTLKRAIYLT